MTKEVGIDSFLDSGSFGGNLNDFPKITGVELVIMEESRKQVLAFGLSIFFEVVDEGFGTIARYIHYPIFFVLPSEDSDLIGTEVDVFQTKITEFTISNA